MRSFKRAVIENGLCWGRMNLPAELKRDLLIIIMSLFCSFMRTHAQAMNEYREGVMSTEVVDRRQKYVDGSCGL